MKRKIDTIILLLVLVSIVYFIFDHNRENIDHNKELTNIEINKATNESYNKSKCKSSKDDAINETIAWLKILDEGKYKETWERAGSQLQNGIAIDKWQKSFEANFNINGSMTERKLHSANPRKIVNGIEGEYQLMIFDSSYERKSKVTEIVYTKIVDGCNWKVVLYHFM